MRPSANIGAIGVLSLLLFFCTGCNPLHADTEKIIDDFVGELLGCKPAIGITLAIVNRTHVLYTKGYGQIDISRNDYVSNTTMFCIASLSKAFASALLGSLLEEHKLSWETHVRHILGEDFYFSDARRTVYATLRDIGSHRMGYPSFNDIRLDVDNKDELAKRIRFLESTKDFRDSFEYNNLMFGLVSLAAEKLGGSSWEQLISQKIFQPLGMTSSSFSHMMDLNGSDVARAYHVNGDLEQQEVTHAMQSHWGILGGSGSIMSNAQDMTKWLQCLLNYGQDEEGNQVIPRSVLEELWTPVVRSTNWAHSRDYVKPNIPATFTISAYGLGWYIGWYRGYRMLMHTGDTWGYVSIIVLLPDVGHGVYLSMNGEDPGFHARMNIGLYCLDLVLGEEPWLSRSDACDFPERFHASMYAGRAMTIERNITPDRPLWDYAGTYGNFAFGNVSVYVDNTSDSDKLMLRYGPIGLWQLHPTSAPDIFDGQGLGDVWMKLLPDTYFHSDDGDTISCLTIPGLERTVRPVFTRDRKMADAPPPPDLNYPDILCGTDGSKQTLTLKVITAQTFLMCYVIITTDVIS